MELNNVFKKAVDLVKNIFGKSKIEANVEITNNSTKSSSNQKNNMKDEVQYNGFFR